MSTSRAGSREGTRMTPTTRPKQTDPNTGFRPEQITAPAVVSVGAGTSSLPRTVSVLPPIILPNEGDVA